MIIDLHTHEWLGSACSRMSVLEAVAAARKRNLDAICITNHDSMIIREAECMRGLDFPVFIGVEMSVAEGDIIAFGVESLPPRYAPAQECIDLVNAQGGFCYAAHPYRESCGLADHIFRVTGLHGIEVWNGANMADENQRALEACRRLGLVALGGSDAHFAADVGRCATWFPSPVTSVQELVAALKKGDCRPVTKTADKQWRF